MEKGEKSKRKRIKKYKEIWEEEKVITGKV
jgi:hypothetical protein